jgi:hypothetical protein
LKVTLKRKPDSQKSGSTHGSLEERLARVPTHLEVQTSQSKDERHAFQKSLFENHAIHRKTIVVDIASFYPPVREPG